MLSIKKFSNILENSLTNVLNKANINSLNHNTNGIDISCIDLNLQIEVKSSFKYSKYHCNTRKQSIRFSHYSFKPNELLGNQEFYIFIEKVNKTDNLLFIKKLEIFVIKTDILRKYLLSLHKDLTKNIRVSVNRIRILPNYNLNQFILLLKNE